MIKDNRLGQNNADDAADALDRVEHWVVQDLFKDFAKAYPERAEQITTISKAGKEIMVLAPFEASTVFEQVFATIERQKEAFGILSWNLAVCNLEEVFLKVASNEHDLYAAPVTSAAAPPQAQTQAVEAEEGARPTY